MSKNIIFATQISNFNFDDVFNNHDEILIQNHSKKNEPTSLELISKIDDVENDFFSIKVNFKCLKSTDFLKNSFVIFKIDFNFFISKDSEQIEVFNHLKNDEITLNEATRLIERVFEIFYSSLDKFLNIFFQLNDDNSRKLNDKFMFKKIFGYKNIKNTLNSYLCISYSEEEEINSSTIFSNVLSNNYLSKNIIFISPYIYMKLGLLHKLQDSYKNALFEFSNQNKTLDLKDINLKLDKKIIASKININENDILDSYINKLSFSIYNSSFVVEYESKIHIHKNLEFFSIPIGFIDDNYSLTFSSKYEYNLISKEITVLDDSYVHLTKKIKIIDIIENLAFRIENVQKNFDDEDLEKYIRLTEDILIKIAEFSLSFVFPLLISMEIGLNPIGSALIFALGDTLSHLLDKEYNDYKIEKYKKELQNIENLKLKFQELIPFNININSIEDCYFNNGLVAFCN